MLGICNLGFIYGKYEFIVCFMKSFMFCVERNKMAMPTNVVLSNTDLTRVFACLILINFEWFHFVIGMNL